MSEISVVHAHKIDDAISTIIHVMHMLISVACRFILRQRKIVAIRSGRPRCEGHILRTSQAMRVALFACTAASVEVLFAAMGVKPSAQRLNV